MEHTPYSIESFGENASNVVERISQIEALGEDILTDKHQLVDLDKKRNGNREAINAIKKADKGCTKSWLCIGNTFFRLEDDVIVNTLRQDQKELDKEISSVRHGLTSKVAELHKMEGQKDVKGFSLTGLSAEDISFIKGGV